MEMDSSFDPTSSDHDRVCAHSAVSQHIASHFHSNNDGKQKKLLVYVSVRIRISLIALQTHSNSWKSFTRRAQKAQQKTSNNNNNSSVNNSNGAPVAQYDKILDSSVTIGSVEDIARLVVSTLWFSSQSAKKIWHLVKENKSEAACLILQANQAHNDMKKHFQHHAMCLAYEKAFLFSLLTQNYQYCSQISVIFHSIAYKLRSLFHVIEALESIFTAGAVCCDVVALAMTIARYADLAFKHVASSPSCAHLRGALAFAFKLLRDLFLLLKLTPFSLDSARAQPLPSVLSTVESLENKATKSRDSEEWFPS